MSEHNEQLSELTEDVVTFSHAMLVLIDAEDWDDERVVRVVGAWLTYVFNNSGLPDEAFVGFIRTLVRAHERRTLQ